MSDERTRRALAEVEEQRDDAVLYLSTIKLVLGVLARGHRLRACGQEIAEVLVRQLAVETGAIVLADGAGGELALAGFATQSQRLGGSAGDLDELGRSNRVKTEFLGMVSHELRTPLNAILGYASLMREGVGGSVSDEHSSFLDRVLGSTRHLNTLIDDILFFVQLEADRVLVRSERVRTERLLEQVLAMIPGHPEPEQVQVRIDIDPRAASIQVDGDLVRRVLFHLVGNALKFTSRGEVLIAVRPGEGDAVTITVRDTGVGIAPERLQQVFDLFAQADSSTTRRYDGLGIGLTLIGRCVRLLGGEVTARSEPGVGSEFRVFLPGVLAAAGQAESRPRFLH